MSQAGSKIAQSKSFPNPRCLIAKRQKQITINVTSYRYQPKWTLGNGREVVPLDIWFIDVSGGLIFLDRLSSTPSGLLEAESRGFEGLVRLGAWRVGMTT
jgi:hypothetical protein